MTQPPPTHPEIDPADEPEESIQEQIDRLLVGIETQEPGTVAQEHLPEGFRNEQASAQAAAQASPQDITEAVSDFEQALAEPDEIARAVEPAASAASEIEPEPLEAEAPQADIDAQLQEEISALLNAEPQPQPQSEADQRNQTDAQPTPSVEDQIADEIEGLLNAGPQETQAAAAQPGDAQAGDPSMDELDKMLADEIDTDDELAGEFHSVQDVTAGIQTPDQEQLELEDEHAASARDVAAELDSQPEDMPAPDPATSDDPLAALAELANVAEANEQAHHDYLTGNMPGWQGRLIRARNRLFNFCYALNWPARQFLSPENRANLGYAALLVFFSAVAVWGYVFFA